MSGEINRAQWMSELSDKVRLFDVLLPGTHDSMAWQIEDDPNKARQLGKWIAQGGWRTQYQTIEEQLQNGIRYFDLRPRDYGNNTYPMHHGGFFLNTYLVKDALQKIENFLDNNERETVIISLKPEEHAAIEPGSNYTSDLLEKKLTGKKYFTTYKDFIAASLQDKSLELTTKNPKGNGEPSKHKLDYNIPLGLLRGKILVIVRDGPLANAEKAKASYRDPNTAFTGFDAFTPHPDIGWGDKQEFRTVESNFSNDILLQDAYRLWPWQDKKLDVVKNFWIKANEKENSDSMLWFNAVNLAYTGPNFSPEAFANRLNPKLNQYFDPQSKSFLSRLRGIVSLDFAGKHQNTVDSIINYNNHLKSLTIGDDVKLGSASGDIFKGLDGNDFIYANGGDDILISDSEGDQLHGGEGNDKFVGLANKKHNESKFNPLIATRMIGFTGNDIFTISEGMYDIDGGAGIDTLRIIINGDYQLERQTYGYYLSTESGSLKVQLNGIEQLEVFEAATTSPEQIGLLDASEQALIEARLEAKMLATEPIGSNRGNFERQQSLSLINPDQYGLQPQLKWYDGNACFPTAVANALAGLATYYSIPELLKKGSTKQNQLLNTLQAVGEAVQTTETGTDPKNIVSGLEDYFEQQDLKDDFEAVNIFRDQEINPLENFKHSPISRADNNYKITNELIAAFARGAVVFSNAWMQPDGTWKRGHVVTGVSLEFDDKNGNMIVDRGEAYATIIDPLNPASNYTPLSIDISGIDNEVKADDIVNNVVQAAEEATPNLQKVEIYQNDYGLAFNYKESSVDYTINNETQTIDIEINSSPEFSKGQFFSATSLRKTSYQGDLDNKIDISDEIKSQDGAIIFSFDDYLQGNKVSAEIFSYFNEESQLSNNLGFYQILDSQGTIQDPITGQKLKPGDFGYRYKAWELSKFFSTSSSNTNQDALANRVSEDHTQMGSFSFQLTAQNNRALLAPIVQTSQGNLFTSFADANADGFNHFVSRGDMAFGFEDLFGLGDKDFNDLQVMMTPLTINGLS